MSCTRLLLRSALMCFAVSLLMFSGCSSTKPAPSATALVNEGYAKAEKMYAKRDYSDAALTLEPLLFSSRATALEDHVLFLLANSYYQSAQYLLASDMFARLLQQVPNSPYARSAQFMLAKSHEKLSPHYELDQQHTVKAIQEYALYMDLYQVKDSARIVDDLNTYRELLKINPDNLSYKKNFASATAEFSRIDSIRYAGKAISQLREKLARNSFSVAKQYVQLKKYKAAAIFYDEVIRRYPDTIYFQPAWAGRIDVMIMRKKWFDASQAVDHYLQLFPDKEHEMVGIRHKITQNQEKN